MNKTEKLDLYHEMVLVRRVEERAAQLYQEGKIGGFLHLYIGQEAVGCGALAARQPQDRVLTAYRDHGIALAAGVEARVVMAELLGKKTGTSKGFGGSMHMADVNLNYWGGHAIVGSHLALRRRHGACRSLPRSGQRDPVLLRRRGDEHRLLS